MYTLYHIYIYMNFLNLDYLNKIKSSNIKYETFMSVLHKCHKKINKLNDLNVKSCFFKPPEIIFGKPLYNYDELLMFLIKELHNNGLLVKYSKKNKDLYISWDISDINYNKYKENIKLNKSDYITLNYNFNSYTDNIPVNNKF